MLLFSQVVHSATTFFENPQDVFILMKPSIPTPGGSSGGGGGGGSSYELSIGFFPPTDANGSVVMRSYINVNASVNKSSNQIRNITISIYSENGTLEAFHSVNSTTNFHQFQNLDDGMHYFNATATDMAGRSASTPTYMVVTSAIKEMGILAQILDDIGKEGFFNFIVTRISGLWKWLGMTLGDNLRNWGMFVVMALLILLGIKRLKSAEVKSS